MVITAVESSNEDITIVQKRIDSVSKEAHQEMIKTGENFGNTLWKNALGFAFLWNSFFPTETLRETLKGNFSGAIFLFAFGVLGVYVGSRDILEGVHHLQIHKEMMKEITSLRGSIARRYDEILNVKSAD